MMDWDPAQHNLILLKLGGSLITDKTQPRKPRLDIILRLAEQIAATILTVSDLKLIIGHGAGSFGHVSAKRYGTRQGVATAEEWRGFADVWWDASALNRLVMEALHKVELPVVALPPSASVFAHDGQVARWDLIQLKAALLHGLIPVVFGDVIFDEIRGGTILSTEDLFMHLAYQLRPSRLLLAGIEPGVWADYPKCTQLISDISPANFADILPALGGSMATDVTGGMQSKVELSLTLAQAIPGLEVMIFSGETPGLIKDALCGARVGTVIHA